MVNYRAGRPDRTFAALGEPTRLAIVARLAAGEASVGELAAPFDMTLAAVMKHLRILEEAGLLTHRKIGRVRRCRLEVAAMNEAAAWIEQTGAFWEDRLAALAAFVEK
jgi:DNA-binding transcriptional ArsR family regulator